jgi:hypothetical protein
VRQKLVCRTPPADSADFRDSVSIEDETYSNIVAGYVGPVFRVAVMLSEKNPILGFLRLGPRVVKTTESGLKAMH